MPTVTQIKVRNGNLADLPVLEKGEFGYATDYQRLFIGNDPILKSGAINPLSGVLQTTFTFNTLDLDPDDTSVSNSTLQFGTNLVYALYVDGILQQPTVDYTVDHSVITFTSAPADGAQIELKYNTEVITQSPESGNDVFVNKLALASASSVTATGLSIDSDIYNYIDIDYKLTNSSGQRKGTISVSIDTSGSIMDDNYITNGLGTDLDHAFSGSIAGSTFNLNYTGTDAADFSYTITNWKSV